MNATEIQAFVTPVQGAAKNIAAASGTNFGELRGGCLRPKAIDGGTTSRVGPLGLPPPRRWTRSPRSPSTKLRPSPVKTFYYDGRASWPKSRRWNTEDEAGEWHGVGTKDGWKIQAGDAGSGSDGITAADTPTVDFVLGTR